MRQLLLLALFIALIVVLHRMYQKSVKSRRNGRRLPGRAEARVVNKDVSELSVSDAHLKDMVSVSGAGEEFEDVDFTVDRRNRYESGRDEWFEISGLHRGKRVHLEYYEDDVVQVQLSMSDTDISLEDLGIGEEDLTRIDEERSKSNTIEYQNERFAYEHSSECTYFRDGLGKGEGYYSWEFLSQDGTRTLYVEKWEDEPFEAGIAKVVAPEDVRVFRS